MPLDRTACERRVYRLAVLLTGDRVGAARVIEAVVGAQPDLASLDNAHIDRLTVLRSREIAPVTLRDAAVPDRLADAMAGLTPQQREAWVFTHVYGLPPRDIARAMDCSVTATTRHLQGGERAMAGATGDDDPTPAVETLLAFSLALDVPEIYRRKRRLRERARRVVVVAGAIVAIAAALGIVLAVIEWLSHE